MFGHVANSKNYIISIHMLYVLTKIVRTKLPTYKINLLSRRNCKSHYVQRFN